MGFAAAALIRSAEGASAVVNVILLPMAFLSGAFGGRDYPAVLQALANVLPLRYFIDLVRAVYLEEESVWSDPRALAVLRCVGPGGSARRRQIFPLGAAGAVAVLVRTDTGLGRTLEMQDLAPIAFVADDGDIRINFGMFAGREATDAEIDELARTLLEEVRT